MKSARMVLVALMGLAPTAALAHGSNGHPADPNLHVNPSLKDCSVQFSSDLTQSRRSSTWVRPPRSAGGTSRWR